MPTPPGVILENEPGIVRDDEPEYAGVATKSPLLYWSLYTDS